MRDLAYLKLLSREYPNIRAAASDIINLQAICGLPKGTEYFFSDLHGEHEAFIYLLRSSSGIIREKIRETFGHIISEEDEVRLANLIYYPEKMINQIKQANEYTEDWQKTAVYRLVQICREPLLPNHLLPRLLSVAPASVQLFQPPLEYTINNLYQLSFLELWHFD